MTGLRIMSLGSSLRNAPQIAGRMIAGSNKELTLRRGLSLVFINFASSSPELFSRETSCLFCHVFGQRAGVHPARAMLRGDQNRLLACTARCSSIGPRARAGKKVRPPIIKITPIKRPTKSPPSVGKVPAEAGTIFLPASEPAMASIGTANMQRPVHMARPSVVFQKGVVAERPAKALPLLPVAET